MSNSKKRRGKNLTKNRTFQNVMIHEYFVILIKIPLVSSSQFVEMASKIKVQLEPFI